jgi:hypothetical protein
MCSIIGSAAAPRNPDPENLPSERPLAVLSIPLAGGEGFYIASLGPIID